MSPSEYIYFFLIGFTVLAVIMFIWLIFRKQKKWAIALTSVLVISYAGYYIHYPTLKVSMHAERYEQVMDYLAVNYPDKEYTILPKHYEEGYTVGNFQVNDIETPTSGVTFRVNE
jgi:hypothetical protein